MDDGPGRPERRGVAGLRRRRRLLLVDDDAWCRGIADGILRSRGLRVFCTGDARTAVSLAREFAPDLVLTDVALALIEPVPLQQRRRTDADPPRVGSGYALLRPLMAGRPLASAPVVLVGGGDDVGWQDALRFDLPDHVPKPFTAQVLLEKVERYLPRAGVETAPADPAGAVAMAPEVPGPEAWSGKDQVVMEGAIDFVGVPAILEMLHANQLTGVCALRSADGAAGEIGFEDGEIVSASTSDGREGAEALCLALSWVLGRFAFRLMRPSRGPTLGFRFEGLMLDCMRRVDEQLQGNTGRASGTRARRATDSPVEP
jgi:CheY-like chemotaxis protein